MGFPKSDSVAIAAKTLLLVQLMSIDEDGGELSGLSFVKKKDNTMKMVPKLEEVRIDVDGSMMGYIETGHFARDRFTPLSIRAMVLITVAAFAMVMIKKGNRCRCCKSLVNHLIIVVMVVRTPGCKGDGKQMGATVIQPGT